MLTIMAVAMGFQMFSGSHREHRMVSSPDVEESAAMGNMSSRQPESVNVEVVQNKAL
jgi:hypothetical protein